MMEYVIPILSALGGLGIGEILRWLFGGKQSNKNTVDNDSHQREKDYFEMVDARTERETNKNVRRIIRCAKHCVHSANCPVLIQWSEEDYGDSN